MLSWTIMTMASRRSMSLCSLALMPFWRSMSYAQQRMAAVDTTPGEIRIKLLHESSCNVKVCKDKRRYSGANSR